MIKIKSRKEYFELSTARRRIILIFMLGVFVILFAQAVKLAAFEKDKLQKESRQRQHRALDLFPYRGKILDRNGSLLAESTPVYSIMADAALVNFKDIDPIAQAKLNKQKKQLAKLLRLSTKDLNKNLKDKSKRNAPLRKNIAPDTKMKIMALKISGISSNKVYKRFYPENGPVAHVVGFTGSDGVGQEGIEMLMNKILAGEKGRIINRIDKNRRVVGEVQQIKLPKDGEDIKLTIDLRLQNEAYNALRKAVEKHEAISGSAVLLDAKTGEVLAMTNYPSFNPNGYNKVGDFIKNRVVTDVFEPGSTMKPISLAAALERKVVTTSTLIDTGKGAYRYEGKFIRDTHPHGEIAVKDIIKVSSNIGSAKISEKVSSNNLAAMYRKFGYGIKTGINFPGEVSGSVRNHTTWKKIDHSRASYGYGMNSTLIQTAQAYTVFANEGKLKPISLIKGDDPKISKRVLSPKTTKDMLLMLESVTDDDGGTAPKAKVYGYRVAGKTGTTKKYMDGEYVKNKYIGTFVGLGPVSNPRFVMAIMIDEPLAEKGYSGGRLAGPVFSRVMSKAFEWYSIDADGLELEGIQNKKGDYADKSKL
ncbi:penicillin-binding protein 2 [Methylophilaceae bacterium]|jgi:cell division protein FtsI (penicillin-binding protein 3)|nr:penicillin-binding protein 2 [Methylophilaceae bacterium]